MLAGAAALADDAAAKRKRRKTKRKQRNTPETTPPPACTGCTAGEACVNGSCQPLAEGAVCQPGAVCARGVCSRVCVNHGQCPAGSSCHARLDITLNVCVADVPDGCALTLCANGEAGCAAGEVCVLAPRGGGEPPCMAVVPA